jgi:hypothetical protein
LVIYAILFYNISRIECREDDIISNMQDVPKQVKKGLVAFWHTPLWLIIVGAAVLGILVNSLTRAESLQVLIMLILSVVVFVRLLAAKGFFAFIVKAVVVIWILLYWFAKMSGH